jgi:hypothetical protein
MKKRLAIAAAVVAVITSVSTPAPAFAGASDNNDATIAGITPGGQQQFNEQECPSGNFCLWTKSNYQGKVFALEYCRTYAMSQWNGIGSYWNHNVGGAHGYLKAQDKHVVIDAAAGAFNASYNFAPIWYVTPCLY